MFSIPFFRSRVTKHVLLRAACFCLGTTSCFAQTSFLTPVASTPYDHQMTPVARVLNSPAGPLASRTSLGALNQWLTNLRAMPYHYSTQWKTPAQVQSDLAADCKGKAILLYAIMRANGATHVRFVIGKHYVTDLRTHAWLEWDTANGTYLLDPTFNRTVERVSDYDPACYIPHYAYNGAHKYRATYYRPSYASIVASN
jgi:transglutaminase-like putative cysteine protease